MWIRVVGTLLRISFACQKIPISGEIHFNTYRTTIVKDMPISGSTSLPCYKQLYSIIIELCRKRVCSIDTSKAVGSRRTIGQVGSILNGDALCTLTYHRMVQYTLY